jgi:dolichol-phosphate mannosyltransferase
MICCVIPTYKARATICGVVRKALVYADAVVVVDDACPQRSGEIVEEQFRGDPAVAVVRHAANRGVGGATKTGFAHALKAGATVIVKLDADDQMDASYIPAINAAFEADPALDYVKGNRFISMDLIRRMPALRLVGNSVLSLLIKFSSGYWNIIDPTNGYFAFRASKLRQLAWQSLSERYFFEPHVLCMLGMRKVKIAEMEMPARYGSEVSSLSSTKVAFEFPPKLLALWWKRILFQYFVFDVNVGSLYLLFGSVLTAAGSLFGAYEWIESLVTRVPRTTGTVMVSVLTIMMGFQLLLNALMHDVQFGAKSVKLTPHAEEAAEAEFEEPEGADAEMSAGAG